jgi:hypothetical protein
MKESFQNPSTEITNREHGDFGRRSDGDVGVVLSFVVLCGSNTKSAPVYKKEISSVHISDRIAPQSNAILLYCLEDVSLPLKILIIEDS